MKRQRDRLQRQLMLSLQREVHTPPILQGSEMLLQALADLLLGAIGHDIEEVANDTGGGNESEDHA
jgi:hypothetical protein